MKQSIYNHEEHKGSQPVRVLRKNIDKWFEETYPGFKEDILFEAITKFGLHDEINIIDRLEKVQMPAGVGTFKVITLQETFLSYVWGLCYSLLYIYDKEIHQPKIDATYVITPEISRQIQKAHELFKYSVSLLANYNPWEIEQLPNPEFYGPEEEYVLKTNGVFLHAMNYVLVHELAHVVLGHTDRAILISEEEAETILKEENEADKYSINMLLKGGDHLTNDSTISAGIVAGICSFIFFSSSMKGGDHPDPDERLAKAFKQLNLQPENNLYGLACLALKLWSNKFKIDLKWPEVVDTYKDLLDFTMKHLEQYKSKDDK